MGTSILTSRMLLSNGLEIPAIGFGPGIAAACGKKLSANRAVSFAQRAWNKVLVRPVACHGYVSAVASAIRSGFRLIDYSAAYGDGSLIRKAIEKSGISRDGLTLTTRVSNRAQFSGTVEEEFFAQLRNLGTDYVDILMFHWPVTGIWQKTWETMVGLHKKGYAKMLGVANCSRHHLEKLMAESPVMPAMNQFEVHPLFTQKPLLAFCRENGIAVEAYTPVARFDDRLVRLPLLRNIAAKYGKSVVQVVLRWHIQNGVVPVVRAMDKSHQKENLSVFDFELSDEEMEAIDGVNINARLRYDPDNCDFSIL